MDLQLTQDNQKELLDTYHGFHDAEIQSIRIVPRSAARQLIDVEAALLCRNQTTQATEYVMLHLSDVSEYALHYDTQYDYACIRDDIAFGFFDDSIFVDFGSACEPHISPA